MSATAEIILYFFIYSVIGWLWETLYCSAKAGHFVYRGFLAGPYCPIYGFGVLLVLYVVKPLHETALELFVFSAVAVSILEYFTACMLQGVFKVTLWNYDKMPLNIQGRIAVPVSVFWGFCCMAVVELVQPKVAGLSEWLYGNFGMWLPAAIAALMLADAAHSAARMAAFKRLMRRISKDMRETEKAGAHRAVSMAASLRGFDRRILGAFPEMRLEGVRDMEKLKNFLTAKKPERNK